MLNKLSKEILSALDVMGYHELLAIQEKVIPHLLANEDVIVKAKTGSGKTASFAIPICENIDWELREPQALVLACTRELANQITQEISEVGRFKKIKAISIIGKEKMDYQRDALKQKCHVVVATPGRLLDHIEQNNVDLSKIRYVVIDEADYMLNLGFVEQVEAILDVIKTQYVKALFSATFPDKLQSLLQLMGDDAIHLEVEDSAQINQYEMMCSDKFGGLLTLLKGVPMESAIVFCNMQEQVDAVARFLEKVEIHVAKIHGGMLQKLRTKQLQAIKTGEKRILVASDVVARGIDIDKVSHVIHFDPPKCESDFIHRCGRSGRNKEIGNSILLYTEEELEKAETFIESYSLQALEVDKNSVSISELNQRADKKNRQANWQSTICKLYLSIGKEKKVRASDIVGSLCSIEGVSQEDIGVITILQKLSYVEMLNGKENLVLAAFKDKKIKNKIVRVEKAK